MEDLLASGVFMLRIEYAYDHRAAVTDPVKKTLSAVQSGSALSAVPNCVLERDGLR